MNGTSRESGNNSPADGNEQGTKAYFRVKLIHSSETQISAWQSGELVMDDEVVVQSRYGKELATLNYIQVVRFQTIGTIAARLDMLSYI